MKIVVLGSFWDHFWAIFLREFGETTVVARDGHDMSESSDFAGVIFLVFPIFCLLR